MKFVSDLPDRLPGLAMILGLVACEYDDFGVASNASESHVIIVSSVAGVPGDLTGVNAEPIFPPSLIVSFGLGLFDAISAREGCPVLDFNRPRAVAGGGEIFGILPGDDCFCFGDAGS